MSLALIYDEYLQSLNEQKERDPLRLFVTDVGKCPRAVALRLSQAPKRTISEGEARNQRFMWDLAEYIESTLMNALSDKGLLEGYQLPIPIEDHENWGGRLDILTTEPRIIEVKTVRSNAFNFDDRPKKEHVYQAAIYSHYLDAPATLAYFDRGGANTPEEYEVEHEWEPLAKMMDELDAVRDDLPNLPPILPKVLKRTDHKKNIKCVPDWRCGYCDYREASCQPHTSSETWAEGSIIKPKADLDVLVKWAEEQADEILRALV